MLPRLVLLAALAALAVGAAPPRAAISALASDWLNADIELHVVEHAGFYLSFALDGAPIVLYSDPYDTGNGFYDGLPAADVVVLTHPHADHYDPACLAKIARPGATLFVAPPDVTEMLVADGYPAGTVLTLANGEFGSLYDGTLGVEAIAAYNLPPNTFHPEGLWNGYVLTINGTRVYMSGDSEDVPEMRALRNIDIAFVAFNLPYTMDVPAAASAVIEFAPAIVYPYHYRESDVDEFKRLIEEATGDVEVRQLEWYPAGITPNVAD